jgi:hypothetical protein
MTEAILGQGLAKIITGTPALLSNELSFDPVNRLSYKFALHRCSVTNTTTAGTVPTQHFLRVFFTEST